MTFLRRLLGKKGSGDEQSTGKTCPSCGQRDLIEVKFCSSCGSEFLIVCDRFDAFISYRRSTGSELASLLKIQLENRFHKQVFLDVNELQVGRFDEELLRRIEETPNFIVLLSRASLDRCANKSDWLKREIMHALKTGVNIIPVLTEDFSFPSDELWAFLPPEMMVLQSLNGIAYSHLHQDSALRKIASYMKTVAENPQPLTLEKLNIPSAMLSKAKSQTSGQENSAPQIAISQSEADSEKFPQFPEAETLFDEMKHASSKDVSKSLPSSTPLNGALEHSKTPENMVLVPPEINSDPKVKTEEWRFLSNANLFLFAKNAIYFSIGAKDSKTRSFCYIAGTVVQFSNKGKDGVYPWYQVPSIDGKVLLFLEGWAAGNVDTKDTRVFFKIAETGQVGYLVNIWEDFQTFYSSIEKICIDDQLLGVVEIKLNEITSMTAK